MKPIRLPYLAEDDTKKEYEDIKAAQRLIFGDKRLPQQKIKELNENLKRKGVIYEMPEM